MLPNPTSNTPKSGLPPKSGAAAGFVVIVSAVVLTLVALLAAGIGIPLPDALAKWMIVRAKPQAVAAKQKSAMPAAPVAKKPNSEWTVLFDGKSLDDWKITEFGGEGEVTVENGAITLAIGNDMTGVSRATGVPKSNYEVELEAMRVDGADFFCGLTFPVKESACSLILGGWGGGLVGLSSLDGFDASENETSSYREFKNGQWYRVRLKVTDARIEAWIDDEQIVDADIENRKVSVRIEVELSRPFGISTWRTKGAIRNIRVRPIKA